MDSRFIPGRTMLLGLLLLLAPATARAQAPISQEVDRACRDDQGTDRCDEAVRQRMLALYGVSAVEEHEAAGDQVRRIFYVDGYGLDVVLIAFVRSPGRDPTMWVHYPQPPGGERPAPQQAPVPQTVWDELITRSEHFDRSFMPLPRNQDPNSISICLHAWVYLIEAVDRPGSGRTANVRRKAESACEDGPGQVFAQDVQRLALPLLPACDLLDPNQHRNAASRLAACHLLLGDRLAAGEVMNLAGVFRSIDGPHDVGRLAGLFGHETRIDWNGVIFQGYGFNAAPFWAGRLGEDADRANLFFERVEGEASDRVRLIGFLQRWVDRADGERVPERARVEQLWFRDLNGDMKVERASVGPWEPQSPG